MATKKPRINIQLPDRVEEYVEERMEQTGLPKSAVVVMALQEWYEAKKNMEKMQDLPSLINELKLMQDKMNSEK